MTNTDTQVHPYTQALLARLDAGTLLRGVWTGRDTDGRELACLLAAISPEVAETHKAESCPAETMPAWLARLTPWIDDAGTDEAWPEHVRRFARTAPAWSRLTARHEYLIRALICREAGRHGSAEICERVAALCDRVAAGESRASLAAEFAAARGARSAAAAWDAADAAWSAAADAAAAVRAAAGATGQAAADRIIAGILTVLEGA